MQANRHTIILMQTSQNKATRTFMDYDSISKAMDVSCSRSWQQEFLCSERLLNFLSCLSRSYDHSLQAYLPYDRQWIKERTFQHLKKLAQ
ncbi:hypothetical protein RJ640_005875 [Escallonia rubra]|uniref:Enhancer of rudimentary homolog n=1 Tax=Escallonia rubra TaxID=112253 RepID=A0AA88UUH9_9ASTE|nr:hypothetical protein RJ640_005875 [Escallonia rubra]